MLVEELHIFLEKFTQLCESNPNEYSLTFEEISDRQNKLNEWYNQLLEIEKEYTFPTIADEIDYYKHQKSEFQKYGIYYDIIYDLELRRSPITLKYYKRKLKELDREFNEIEHYVVYYRSNAMDKDDLYFVKDSKENHIFALVKAHMMLTKYLLHKTDSKTADEIIASSTKVKWKLTGTDIMEMAKAFSGMGYAEGTLGDIAESMGRYFGKDIKNVYSKSHNVTNRLNPAKFLEGCANWLKKMNK